MGRGSANAEFAAYVKFDRESGGTRSWRRSAPLFGGLLAEHPLTLQNIGGIKIDIFARSTFGTAAMAVLFSVAASLILTLLSLAEEMTEAWGWNFYFFRLPYINSGPAVQQAGTIFGILLSILFTGIGIASVYQRYGRLGMLVFFTGSLLVSSIGSVILTATGMWSELFGWLIAHSAASVATWLVLLAVLCALLSHCMLRRANA